MEFDLPVRGLEPLEPLGGLLLLYLIFLAFLWLFLRPALLAIARRGTFSRLLRFVVKLVTRLALFGLMALAFLWALAAIGMLEQFYEWVFDLPDLVVDLPRIGLIAIPVALLLAIALIYIVIRPLFTRVRGS